MTPQQEYYNWKLSRIKMWQLFRARSWFVVKFVSIIVALSLTGILLDTGLVKLENRQQRISDAIDKVNNIVPGSVMTEFNKDGVVYKVYTNSSTK